MIGDAQASENIVQDIFVKIWTDRDTLQVTSSVKAYLYVSVKNRALNYIKREKKKVYSFEELYLKENGLQTPEDEMIDRELYFNVHQAINKLPEKCKRVYLMHHYDNLSYAEIAEIQNISLNTVKTHMKRALKILNKKLSKLI